MTSSPISPYRASFDHAMASLTELEGTWRELAESGAISQYEAHQHIVEIGLTKERLLDDFFA